MSENENDLLKNFGIHVKIVRYYCYKQYQYKRLEDAIAYSILDSKNEVKLDEKT